ncbi:MAG: MEDS domain-containing protein, partial [Nocardioidaceae bacterium]
MGRSDQHQDASLGWDGHLLLLSASEPERRSLFGAWARHGLELGERIVYAYADTCAGEASLRHWVPSALAADGVEVTSASTDGRLSGVSMTELCQPGGPGRVLERAQADGFRGVRITGDVAEVLTAMPGSTHIRIEQALDELCATRPVSVLCHCGRAEITADLANEIIELHPAGIRELMFNTADRGDRVVLAGEVDLTNEQVLEHAVRGTANRSNGTLRLDLSGLTFLSCGGCRALAVGTQPYRDRGGTVQLADANPLVNQVVCLFGLDRLPGVRLVGVG